MNGSMGNVITAGNDGSLVIDFDGRSVQIDADSEGARNVQLAYVTSIHKVQGSEFPCAVVIAHKSQSFMHHRNLLYTAVTRAKESVIILGDGRGNRTDPRADILARMADRSKQIVWLNPEVRQVWGTGDSDMPRYAAHCRVTAVCNTLKHLERVISDLLRDGG